MAKFTVELVPHRETKRTFLYRLEGDVEPHSKIISDVYVSKSFLPDGSRPEKITVTLEYEEEGDE